MTDLEAEIYELSSIKKDPAKYVNPHNPIPKCVPLQKTYKEMAVERLKSTDVKMDSVF